MRAPIYVLVSALVLLGCTANGADRGAPEAQDPPFRIEPIGQFSMPWAMVFLPGGRQALVTEKRGALKLWTQGGAAIDVAGVPSVDYGGQGGLGDVILHPEFASNGLVYLSFAEAGEGGNRGAAVGRGAARRRRQCRPSRRLPGDLAPAAQDERARPLRPSPRLLARRALPLHQLGRAPGIHAGPGHERQSRQDPPPESGRKRSRRQSFRRARRGHRPDLDARAIATRSASPSRPTGSCGKSRWARPAATR